MINHKPKILIPFYQFHPKKMKLLPKKLMVEIMSTLAKILLIILSIHIILNNFFLNRENLFKKQIITLSF